MERTNPANKAFSERAAFPGMRPQLHALFTSPSFSAIAMILGVLLGGIVFGQLLAGRLGDTGFYIVGALLGVMMLASILFLNSDELTACFIVIIGIVVDWYLHTFVIALVVAGLLLFKIFGDRSEEKPWAKPRALWLWFLFLGLALFPAINGALSLFDIAFYYPCIICGALIMFWLGTVVARNDACLHRFFKGLAAFGTLIAIHAIIQATTGIFLFATTRYEAYIALENFGFAGYDITRTGSIFFNPDASGAFFGMMLCIPLGLSVRSPLLREKVIYFVEMSLMATALLFSYSTSAWMAFFASLTVFLIFVGSNRYRFFLPLLIAIAGLIGTIAFPLQVQLQLQHASDPRVLLLRTGAWQTAIRVISAFPLTGIGLGTIAYAQRADPFRVPAQYISLSQPHDSYLEFGAMAGIPVLSVFLALLLFAFWQAVANWRVANQRAQPLLASGMAAAIALTANSISDNIWTFAPLSLCGWMILGMISSPLLTRYLKSLKEDKKGDYDFKEAPLEYIS